jgi:hypothetical protein
MTERSGGAVQIANLGFVRDNAPATYWCQVVF